MTLILETIDCHQAFCQTNLFGLQMAYRKYINKASTTLWGAFKIKGRLRSKWFHPEIYIYKYFQLIPFLQ